MEPMMLKDSYFKILDTRRNDNAILFRIELNPSHKVYEGHFPGMPVCPGVCNVEMIKECVQEHTGKRLILNNLLQCKFSAVITPSHNPLLLISLNIEEMDGETIKVKGKITDPDGSTTFIDFKGEFQTK